LKAGDEGTLWKVAKASSRRRLNVARERVMSIVLNPIRREAAVVLEEIRVKDEKRRREIMNRPGRSPCDRPAVDPTYFETYKQYQLSGVNLSFPSTTTKITDISYYD
jgi:hypothetical protein